MPSRRRSLPGPLSRAIVRVLTDEMKRQSVTQTWVASNVSFSQSQLSRLLGLERVMTLDDLDEMCEVLTLDIVSVVERADRNR